MINVGLDNLKPGMVLAQPVRNRQGALLLETGSKVSKKSIRILKSWGISNVSVKGNLDKAQTDASDTEIHLIQSIEKELEGKFCDVLDDPVMVEIFNAARKQLARTGRNNKSENEHS
jgi:hypothetical protein